MRFVKLSDLSPPTAPWLVRRKELLPVPPERAWQALTRPEELARWWCDDADVKLRPGGTYRFGGRHSYPGSEGQGSGHPTTAGDFEIVTVEEPCELSFRWTLDGAPTIVTYELIGMMESTELTVTQSGDAAPGHCWGHDAADRDAMPNWWWFYLPALRTYLEKGAPDLRLDFGTLHDGGALQIEASFSTFPWLIWHKLTSPTEAERWWETQVELEPTEGGLFRHGFQTMGAERIITWEEGTKLRHDWRWGTTHRTEVEWNVAETEQHTSVSVCDATPLTIDGTRHFSAIFWCAHLLNLKQLSERGIRPRDHQIFYA